ncbi:hypothetical protein GCK72_015707 [Caenorhabditis remanei]|uniref:Uncharacterized protein n=1 Tax=Caenorhabditis remanei TaxID=31234 RepID=A0A6A5GXB8_CAERE|nr:hypothetical protein GCK72_015707 [Caenorhabditis remanei]KAF1759244.1 hypothetical protein GCK72_015707 [Caenorhabditis remanei]
MILELSYCRSLTVVNSNKIIIQVQKIEGCRLKYGVIQFLTLFVGDAKARWENMQNFDDLENGNDWRTHWHVKDYKKHNKTHWQKIFKRYQNIWFLEGRQQFLKTDFPSEFDYLSILLGLVSELQNRLNLGPNKPDDPDFRERRTAPPKRRRTGRRRSSESSSSPPPPPPRRVLPPPIPFIDNYESIHVPKGTRLAQIQQERDRRLRARLGPKPPKIQKTQFESAEAKKAKRAARTTVAVLRDERGWTRFRSHRYTAPKFHNDPGYSDDVENQGENVESSDIEDWDSEDNDEEEEDETEGRKELWEMPQDQSTISRLSTAIETKKWCLVEELIKAGFQVHSLLFRRFNLVDEICSAANNIPEEFQNLFELLAQRGADIRMAYIDERTPTRLKRIEERDFYLDLIRKSLSDEIKVIYQKSITSGFPVITFPGNENGRILSIQRSSFRIEELEDDKKYAFVIVAMEWDGETFQVRQHLPLLTLRFNQEKIPIKCHETPLTEYPAFYSIHPTKGKNEFEIHLKQRMNGFIAVWPILVVEESSLEEKEDDGSSM